MNTTYVIDDLSEGIKGMTATAYGECEKCETRYQFQFHVKNSGDPIGPFVYCPVCGTELEQ